ncbi:NAD(P)-dependent oxidoreductase [Tunicatimonas pelagia]|uniref:NAD(P)-dependent oxidoreductase n=1 Tax=Tunicatimonas pelagia TaxID=931531 RepID=UPI002665BB1E|nr:NAD(P)-dependent oxidoreductase [Tunicatimonas pelagia]WKN43533.1 NAD(P)-dependent oxidoreductase [Tunicatimonas pelagia]
MKKILVSYTLPEEGLKPLKEHFEVIYPTDKYRFSREEILDKIAEVDGYLAVNVSVDAEIIDAAAALKIIANYGVGYDSIDVDYATQQGIVVTNTPTAVTEATAETAFGLILSLLRNITYCDRKLRNGDPGFTWGMLQKHTGSSLYGKTLGIIGLGRIGQAVARRAITFGMNILYYQRNRLFDHFERLSSARYVPLEELLTQSDVVSLHTPLTESTRHLLGAAELDRMKPSAFLINTARGPVVDEQALIHRLQTGKLAGAGLDVYEEEPHIPNELLQLENVVLTPHIGTETIEARIAMAHEATLNLLTFFEGKNPPHQVN